MGYAILMQWTLTPTPPGRMGISDLVLSRILEHYNISHPMRSTIQLRTFRAIFPIEGGNSSNDAEATPPIANFLTLGAPPNVTRLLTTLTHSLPIPHARDVPMAPGARDNVTYLFLEDRGVPGAEAAAATEAKSEKKEDKEPEKDKAKLEEDGFEIVDPKDEDKKAAESAGAGPGANAEVKTEGGDEPMAVDPPPAAASTPAPTSPGAAASGAGTASGGGSKYKILAVKPATLVMPTLHQLLSPFVLGLNKSARAAASTTAQAAAPTPLAGSPLMITTLTFPPMPHPQPSISLSVHILPNAAAQTIFLEAEWDGSASVDTSRAILREFLLGCVPVDVPGEPRFMYWEESGAPGARAEEEGESDGDAARPVENPGWYGVEKTRRITFMLAKALRENQYI